MADDSTLGDVPEDEQPQDAVAEAVAPDDAESQDESTAPEPQDEVTQETADAPAQAASAARTEPAPARASERGTDEARPNRRKVREGLVVSIKMDKTAVVGVVERVRHPRYAKTVQRTKRLYAHDARNDLRVGDRVRVAETRPLSKLKRWRVVEVLERAK